MRRRGLTLIELMVAMGVSSLLMLTVVILYSRGLVEVQHSSGRVELMRRARAVLERMQPVLCSAVKPSRESNQEAIYVPDQPVDDLIDNGTYANDSSFHQIVFSSPVDWLTDTPLPSGRTLSLAPRYFLHEIAQIPSHDGAASDVVLRRVQSVEVLAQFQPHQFQVVLDPLVRPKILGRNLDWLNVRYLRPGAVQVQVVLSSGRIQDSGALARARRMAPYTVEVSSLIQIPFYSLH